MSTGLKMSGALGLVAWFIGAVHADTREFFQNPLLELTATEIASAYGEERRYDIKRNGKNIGEHVLSFQQDSDSLTVSVDSSLSVRLLGIPVYRLAYEASELWMNNRLITASATTTENGRSNTVTFDSSKVTDDTRFASNHWHPGVLDGESVFNTLTGDNSKIEVSYLGLESVDTPTGSLQAHHYQYEDDIHANVWYDTDGLWLKMKFEGEDGSLIEYIRQQ